MRIFGRLLSAFALGTILAVLLGTTVLAHDQADDVLIYVSSTSSGTVDGIEFKDEDILAYNSETDTWAMHFDGSDVGMNGRDINAFHIVDDGNDVTLDSVLFSLKNGRSFGSFYADDSDIVEFVPSSLGANTAGTFALYFDGSDVGLSANSEEVDAIALLADNGLVISTSGSHRVPGVNGADEDLILFTATSLGSDTAGTFAVYFDGSDVGLTRSDEDVWGTWVDADTGNVYLTTKDEFSVSGLSGDQEDIFVFAPFSLGTNTSGSFSAFWNGDTHRFAGERLDAFSLEFLNAPPVAQDDDFAMLEDGVLAGENVLADNGNGADSDPDGDPLTVNTTPASGPSSGVVVLQATGDFTYTPAPDFNGTDTFEYEIDDGNGETDIGLVTIMVAAVNDAPSFVAGADEVVLEDAGAQTVAGWATAISAGPANESGQTLTFNVSNDNNGLFSAQPAIDATGTLTYTPAADANGSAIVDVTVMDDGGTANGGDDTSATQQFTITVTAVNDEPSFTAGADEVVLEDAGAQTVAGWATAISAGPADEAGQTLSFNVSNDNNGLFSSQPAIDAAGGLTYTPAADANGSAIVDVSLMDDGGTANGGVDTSVTQQFTITVVAVNDAPSFTAGADEVVLEVAGAQSVAGWATAISAGPADEAGQTLTFNVSNDNNGLFSVQPAVDAATGELTYTPAADANGLAIVDVSLMDDGGTANGGVDTSVTQQFTITVTAVNDAPSFTAGANEVVLEDAGAQSVAGWATAISAGPADESGQTLTFNVSNDNNGLFSVQPAVDAATGDLSYTPAADANGLATVDVSLMDDGGTANGGVDTSATQQFTITVVAVNDEPSFTTGPDQSVQFDAGPQTVPGWATAISAGPADESGQTLTFNITNNTNPGLFTAQPAVDASGTLTYTPDATPPATGGTATITLELMDDGGTANGGDDTSLAQTFDITVSVDPVLEFDKVVNGLDADDPNVVGPVPILSPGDPVTFEFLVTSNTGAAVPAADITIADDYLGTITSGGSPLPVTGDSNGNSLLDNGETWTYVVAGNAPTLPLTAPNVTTGRCDASQAPDAMDVHRNVATLTIPTDTQNDSAHLCVVVAPTAVDDAAAATSSPGDDWHTALDTTLTVVAGSSEDLDANDSLGNPTGAIVSFGGGDLGGAVTDNAAGATVTVGGAGSLTVNADGSLTFTPDTGFVGLFMFDYRLENIAGTSDATVTLAVGTRPAALDDNGINVLGNVGIDTSIAPTFSVLTNDSGDGTTITGLDTGATLGAVVLDAPTGQFTYNPPADYQGTDSFDYTISNGFGSSTGTVTLTVADMIWFIDNTAGGIGGSGTLADPFRTIGDFNAAAGPGTGDSIYLAQTGTDYGDGIVLAANQLLIGEGTQDSNLQGATGVSVPPFSNPLPPINGTRPVIATSGNGVTLAAGNTVRGLNVSTTGGTGVLGTSVGSLLINDVEFVSTSGASAIDLSGGTLNVTLASVSSTGGSAPGIRLVSTTGALTVAGSGDGVVDCRDSAAACAGGSITGKTGNGDGVLLNSATNVALNEMNISSNTGNGVLGIAVNGFTISDSRLMDNTDSADPNENGINLDELAGTSAITNTRVANSTEHNVEVRNSAGAATLNVTGSIFENDGSSGLASTNLNFLAQGSSSLTLNVQSSEFIGNRAAGFLTASGVFADGQSTATLDATVQNSLFEDNNNAINVSHSGSGTVTFDISNNGTAGRPIVGNLSAAEAAGAGGASTAINVVMSTTYTGTASGVIDSNIIGNDAITESGSATGRGIVADLDGSGTLRVEIANNTIRQTDFNGIRSWTQDTDGGDLFVKVTGNSFRNITSLGIYIRSRDGASNTACAVVSGNTADATVTSDHVRVRQDTGVVSLEVGSANLADPPLTVLTTNNPGAGSWDAAGAIAVVANNTCGF